MKIFPAIILFGLYIFFIGITSAADFNLVTDTTLPLFIKADYIKYTESDEQVYARGKVRLTYGQDTLRADEIWFTFPTRLIHAKGTVKLTRSGFANNTVTRLDCDEVTYELDSYRGIASNTHTTIPPWFVQAPEIEQLNRFEQYLRQPSFTTCEIGRASCRERVYVTV